MTTDDQYVPDEGQVRAWCREGTGDYPDVMDEWLDRFLARVRRDAAREALDGLIDAWLGKYGTPETRDAGIAARDYRETNYRLPEETPND